MRDEVLLGVLGVVTLEDCSSGAADKSRQVSIAFAFPCNAHATNVVVNHALPAIRIGASPLSWFRSGGFAAFSGFAAVDAYDVKGV